MLRQLVGLHMTVTYVLQFMNVLQNTDLDCNFQTCYLNAVFWGVTAFILLFLYQLLHAV